MRRVIALLVLSLVLLGLARPWPTRRRPGVRPNYVLTDRVLTTDWPAEPASPRAPEPARFARALHELCGYMPPGRDSRWTDWILRESTAFSVDPFLVAALIYRQSRCTPDAENLDGPGLGLSQIHRDMYSDLVRDGVMRYRVRDADAWAIRERTLDRFPFGGPRLLLAEPNIHFTAALLAMWRDQDASLDGVWEQVPHRHYVSHFVWGDAVRSDWEEERILTDRRRMLEYYGAHTGMTPIHYRGVELGCPLDGCPRVVLSWLGAERDEGGREHRGIDLDSLPGEPVRAVADGFVYFAGVDLPGHRSHEQVARAADYDRYDRDGLGAGGRYACIRHARDATASEEGGSSVRTCYMHLETVEVSYGQTVRRGQRIGTVGRTGMQRSAAHLHLELEDERLEDPSAVMNGLLLGRRPADPRMARR
jgi:Peptidase family M23